MEWVANAIALGFAVVGLASWWGWVRSEMARGGELQLAAVKRGFFWSVAGLLALVPAAMVPLLLVYERDFTLALGLACGVFFSGVAPVAIFMYLATTQFMRSEGREPVVLGAESRRELRKPIAGGIAGAFVVATLTIWLIARPPLALDPHWVLSGALALTFACIAWPMLAINACANRERAARARAG